jgi:hypothetical protein
MAMLKLDLTTGRLAVEDGGFADVDGIEEIRQLLWLRLQQFLGECVYDTTIGLPWVGELSQPGTSPERFASLYRDVILGTAGVLALTKGPVLAINADRGASITFTASTDEGELVFSGPIAVRPTQTVE